MTLSYSMHITGSEDDPLIACDFSWISPRSGRRSGSVISLGQSGQEFRSFPGNVAVDGCLIECPIRRKQWLRAQMQAAIEGSRHWRPNCTIAHVQTLYSCLSLTGPDLYMYFCFRCRVNNKEPGDCLYSDEVVDNTSRMTFLDRNLVIVQHNPRVYDTSCYKPWVVSRPTSCRDIDRT